jgi:hypothetical protein
VRQPTTTQTEHPFRSLVTDHFEDVLLPELRRRKDHLASDQRFHSVELTSHDFHNFCSDWVLSCTLHGNQKWARLEIRIFAAYLVTDIATSGEVLWRRPLSSKSWRKATCDFQTRMPAAKPPQQTLGLFDGEIQPLLEAFDAAVKRGRPAGFFERLANRQRR